MLASLDSLLELSQDYETAKTARLDRLRSDYAAARDDDSKYRAALSLYDGYAAFDSDSALLYADRALAHAAALHRTDLVDEMELNRCYVFSATGMIEKAEEALVRVQSHRLSPHLTLKYYDRLLFLETHRDQSDGHVEDLGLYASKTDDRIGPALDSLGPDNRYYGWMLGWNNMQSDNDAAEAIRVLEHSLDGSSHTTRLDAMNEWVLATLYKRTGDDDQALRHLILSAMADIRACNREIASLEEIAGIMLDRRDLRHADAYFNFCLTCANEYKSRPRITQLARKLEETQNAMRADLEKERRTNRAYLTFLIVVSVLLAAAVVLLMRRNGQLHRWRREADMANTQLSHRVDELQQVRSQLHESNLRLSAMNEEVRSTALKLAEVNESKETQLAAIFSLCSSYISRNDEFRSELLRLLSERKTDEAMKILKSPELAYSQVKELHANFDKAFLEIFPDFVADFNTLLLPDQQIKPKDGGKLTTELRIYALVRLGLNDSIAIARFLHCSVQTVYNTRRQTRAKSEIPKGAFAEAVRNLGKPSL